MSMLSPSIIRQTDSSWETVSEDDRAQDQLQEVYRDGSILIRHKWEDVVKRAAL
jgi:hypothetical protein